MRRTARIVGRRRSAAYRARMPNRLAASTSPYLRQHAENPVDWYEWGPEAFNDAARRDVPVLLSVGYATCHWCHVMAHESFEDDATAAYMNANLVSVKVDREERPDIDRVYMDAVVAVSGRGGWPMTVFLTPDGKPIHAGTYYPPERRGHHPSFLEVMQAVVDVWESDRPRAERHADDVARALSTQQPARGSLPTVDDIDRAVSYLASVFDRVNGGFGRAPKFPQAPTLEFLLRVAALRPGTDSAETATAMLSQMLDAMSRGGIHDHLGGGFARYSVDAQWLIPHFEKMLYDNALLARIYLRTWQLTGNDRFRTTAIEVLDWLDSTMADARGGLHSAEDADSEGVEGKFAVWSWDELAALLGDDLPLAAAIYGATPGGNFEGSNNLHRFNDLAAAAASLGVTTEELEEGRRRIDTRLRAARAERVPPDRDDKVVTAWNAFALRAFAEAAMILQDRRYLDRAEAIARFLTTECSPDGALARSWRDRPGHAAFAEDHAAISVALYTLYSVTGDEHWFTEAERHVAELRSSFADPDGGFHATRADAEPLVARPKNMQDNPTPSDNALAMEALVMHAAYTGDLAAHSEVEATMEAISPSALSHPTFGGYALAIWLTVLAGVKEVAVVGDDTALLSVVWNEFRPDLVLALGRRGGPSIVPLLTDRPPTSPPMAYVCRDLMCAAPTGEPGTLRHQLDDRF